VIEDMAMGTVQMRGMAAKIETESFDYKFARVQWPGRQMGDVVHGNLVLRHGYCITAGKVKGFFALDGGLALTGNQAYFSSRRS